MRPLLACLLTASLAACSSTPPKQSSTRGAHGTNSTGAASPALPSVPPTDAGARGYYRFPTIRGDVIVFAAEGDLWQVARTRGVAARLTSHMGNESSPAISADGATIAFSAAYEGPTEVYTMPRAGGTPVRRTFDGDAKVI